MKISLIAAFAEEGVIGKDGKIPWTLKEDLKHFRHKTEGCSVVMGRKTYESIGRPLPNRLNIVMTRNPKRQEGIKEVSNTKDALKVASSYSDEIDTEKLADINSFISVNFNVDSNSMEPYSSVNSPTDNSAGWNSSQFWFVDNPI